jgi:guanylate kinase
MDNTAPIIARAQRDRKVQMQHGTVLSLTTVRHPPAGFPDAPRRIAMLQLEDGKKVLGLIVGKAPLQIGDTVAPRLRLTRVSEDGLRRYDACYEPVVSVREELTTGSWRYIVALTGPSGVGKSTVNALLGNVFSDYVQPVPILTTRPRRKGDSNEYRYVTPEEFVALRSQGDIIAATHIPSTTEERWYGYQASDIEAIWRQGKIPTVVTEMHLLQDLARHYGRRSILSCGLLPPGKSRRAKLSQLLHRLRARGRDSEESIRDRLRNAEEDLKFFDTRTDLFDHILVNEDLESVIGTLKDSILQLVQPVRPAQAAA